MSLRDQIGAQYSTTELTKAEVAVRNVVAPALQPGQQVSSREQQDILVFLRSGSRCRRYVSDLSNVTPKHLGSEQKSRVSSLKLTLDSHLTSFLIVEMEDFRHRFIVLSFNIQVWRYLPIIAMCSLSTLYTTCQSPST